MNDWHETPPGTLAILERESYLDPWQGFLNVLKSKSDYWPKVYQVDTPGGTYASTIVRILRDDKWYKVHCVETVPIGYYHELNKKIRWSVYKIQLLYKICGMEELDDLQISEQERILNMFP